jgi:hypothetical protein
MEMNKVVYYYCAVIRNILAGPRDRFILIQGKYIGCCFCFTISA